MMAFRFSHRRIHWFIRQLFGIFDDDGQVCVGSSVLFALCIMRIQVLGRLERVCSANDRVCEMECPIVYD